MDRRSFLSRLAQAAAATGAVQMAATGLARAEDVELTPLPSGVDPRACPGLSWAGSGPAAIEIFDYNCPYCRAVFRALDARVGHAGALRLGLIDSPQLSIGSIQAAKLRQAVLKLYGPAKAYAFHRRLFASRGAIDGEVGLAAVRALKLDVAKVTDTGDGDGVRNILIGQSHFLNSAGARATPSFILAGKMLSGWPGPEKFDLVLHGA